MNLDIPRINIQQINPITHSNLSPFNLIRPPTLASDFDNFQSIHTTFTITVSIAEIVPWKRSSQSRRPISTSRMHRSKSQRPVKFFCLWNTEAWDSLKRGITMCSVRCCEEDDSSRVYPYGLRYNTPDVDSEVVRFGNAC
jgi:hypothetical protein